MRGREEVLGIGRAGKCPFLKNIRLERSVSVPAVWWLKMTTAQQEVGVKSLQFANCEQHNETNGGPHIQRFLVGVVHIHT